MPSILSAKTYEVMALHTQHCVHADHYFTWSWHTNPVIVIVVRHKTCCRCRSAHAVDRLQQGKLIVSTGRKLSVRDELYMYELLLLLLICCCCYSSNQNRYVGRLRSTIMSIYDCRLPHIYSNNAATIPTHTHAASKLLSPQHWRDTNEH
jgi:hypothetical protein